MYQLLLGKEINRAWKMFNERKPSTQLTSHQAWHEYGRYDIPHAKPHGSRPLEFTFFTPLKVRTPIDGLKAQNHHGLAGEHFIYACDPLLLHPAQIFNRTV